MAKHARMYEVRGKLELDVFSRNLNKNELNKRVLEGLRLLVDHVDKSCINASTFKVVSPKMASTRRLKELARSPRAAIHHVDGDVGNNDLENLRVVDARRGRTS